MRLLTSPAIGFAVGRALYGTTIPRERGCCAATRAGRAMHPAQNACSACRMRLWHRLQYGYLRTMRLT